MEPSNAKQNNDTPYSSSGDNSRIANADMQSTLSTAAIIAAAFNSGRDAARFYEDDSTMRYYRTLKVKAINEGIQAIAEYMAAHSANTKISGSFIKNAIASLRNRKRHE